MVSGIQTVVPAVFDCEVVKMCIRSIHVHTGKLFITQSTCNDDCCRYFSKLLAEKI